MGKKENVYFVVDNKENIQRRNEGKHSQYWDDRGTWEVKGTTDKTPLLERNNGEYMRVRMKGNMYCVKQQKDREVFYEQVQHQGHMG